MFYTKVGRFVAALLLIGGILQLVSGLFIAFGTETMEDNMAVARPFDNSGEMINKAQFYIFIAIALGIATEISVNIREALLGEDQPLDEDE